MQFGDLESHSHISRDRIILIRLKLCGQIRNSKSYKNINFELTFLVKSRIQNVTKNVNFELTFFLQDVNFELTSFLENVNSELTFSKNVHQSEA